MTLFEPLTIRGMRLKNRIVMPAMQLCLGMGNPRARTYYLARAQGGAAAIIMAATAVDLLVDDAAWGRPGGVDRLVAAMQPFTDQVRQAGCRIGIQLWHGNQLPAGNGAGAPEAEQVAPSTTDAQRALTVTEIEGIIDKFGRAAATARTAGFDFVEVHGAHGYLVCQFFSGADNQRTDRYGGDLQSRMRFGIEVVQAIRAATGEDFPIFYRLGAEEKRPGGITLHQSCAFARELESAGVDALDVSVGKAAGRTASPSKRAQPATFVPLARAIKQSVSIPVMGVGRINTGELAQSVLDAGSADLIGVGRQLIADPQYPNKIQAGRQTDIVACTSCNTCFTPLTSKTWRPGDQICKVNPRAGRELDGGEVAPR